MHGGHSSAFAWTMPRIGLLAGAAAFILFLLLPLPGLTAQSRAMLAVASLMAAWWLTEAIPIPATSLLPIALFPVLGIMPVADAAAPYANDLVFLFLGGFMLALAVERSGLHRRLALRVIAALGTRPSRLLLGFMLATAFLSMWISNTATTLMMLPIALAVLRSVRVDEEDERSGFRSTLLLGVAYAASIGGVATLIGTPPNIVLAGFIPRLYPGAPEITFFQWMLFGVPLSTVFLPAVWLYLRRRLPRMQPDGDREVIRRQLDTLGPPSQAERRVLAVFLTTAACWIFRSPLDLGGFRLPGLTDAAPGLSDAGIAIASAVLLFLLPSGQGRERLLDWKTAQKGVPWGILLLFGGGFALGDGMRSAGVTAMLGQGLASLGALPPLLMVVLICVLLTFLTELTSNTATASILLPVMGAAAVALGQHPLLFMVPAAVNSSYAFMLPVATPPNAIVFSSQFIGIREMARTGFALNLLGVALVTTLMYALGLLVFGIEVNALPGWVH